MGQSVSGDGEYCEKRASFAQEPARKIAVVFPGCNPRWLIWMVYAVLPASTVNTVPVMFFALSPSRNSTAFATSSIPGNLCGALREPTHQQRTIVIEWSAPVRQGSTCVCESHPG